METTCLAVEEAKGFPASVCVAPEGEVIRVREWWEANAKFVMVGTTERIYANEAGEVEMLLMFSV